MRIRPGRESGVPGGGWPATHGGKAGGRHPPAQGVLPEDQYSVLTFTPLKFVAACSDTYR